MWIFGGTGGNGLFLFIAVIKSDLLIIHNPKSQFLENLWNLSVN